MAMECTVKYLSCLPLSPTRQEHSTVKLFSNVCRILGGLGGGGALHPPILPREKLQTKVPPCVNHVSHCFDKVLDESNLSKGCSWFKV